MATVIFNIILLVIICDFVFDRILSGLNASWRSKPIPALLAGVYDNNKYSKQQSYSVISYRFSWLINVVSFLVVTIFFLFKGFAWLHYSLSASISSTLLNGLCFFSILMLALDLITLPFEWYSTFVIEERFGFNNSTKKIFLTDKLKNYLVSGIIGGGLYSVIYWLYTVSPTYFWIWCWAVITIFSLFMVLFYSNLIVPLFNKQTPLPTGELRSAIEGFAAKAGFSLDNIYVIDGSKRSSRANAYFTGLGSKKRVVLYDTLINTLSVDEIVAVLAHEIGHYKNKHIVWSIILGSLQNAVMFYLLSLFVNNPLLSQAMGVKQPVFHVGLMAFSLLYSPITTIIGVVLNYFSRKHEYQADNFASKYGLSKPLISALKKLASDNLSNLTPHPAYVFVNYSHPDLYKRVQNLDSK